MKQTTKEYLKDIRNWYHVFVGIPIGYALILLFGFNNRKEYPYNFTLTWEDFDIHNLILPPFIILVFLGVGSFLWERRQDRIKEGSSDMRDVYVSMISGLVGGYLAMIYGNIWIAVFTVVLAMWLVVKHYKK